MLLQHYLVVAGSIAIVVSIITSSWWAQSFAGRVFRESSLIGETSLDPTDSLNATLQVNDIDSPISLTINSKPKSLDSYLSGMIINPHGQIVNKTNFTKQLYTTVLPKTTGNYTLTVTNLGPYHINIDAVFGYLPFTDSIHHVNAVASISASGALILFFVGLALIVITVGLSAYGWHISLRKAV